ncbi:MAG TPA: ABC transporter ATP-binding protein [Bacillota bacterium]|nr:ABC transporter ATP-binding protein [Bacillota bacterium]
MLIKLEQVTKFYGRSQEILPVKAVDLTIERGEWVSVVGPSGCGKTTLLNLAGCLLRPASGRVLFEGIDTGTLKDGERTALRNAKIGFVFQGSYLLPTLTVVENVLAPVLFNRSLTKVEKREKREESENLLAELGLGDRLHSLPYELSLGQRRRAAVARALINKPVILLADEPTNDLDPIRADQIAAILEELNHKGLTILMVTHHPELAARAERQYKLNQGKLEPAAL